MRMLSAIPIAIYVPANSFAEQAKLQVIFDPKT